ncbi:hypothetical protein K227x_55420 [Rubripirellula lacrimiformis]|uniref:DUF389 domain-containing protein n=1 Tax=Rubripirellula lacrimiformis TaxID=1930273 RepID=A0A517NJ09_9BACT|nr:DUF389 domain-containing protein [Rubripirellula lacrimiformis]QDT07117.1 hypothetical protein K227x_55420 [Rubripirellula lacrimiformis]
MSIVFVMGSEQELRFGAPWCQRMANLRQADVHLVVLGEDSKILTEQVNRKAIDYLGIDEKRVSVHSVAREPERVIELATSVGCSQLLMSYQNSDHQWQQAVFEQSIHSTVWIHIGGEGPNQEPTNEENVSVAADPLKSAEMSDAAMRAFAIDLDGDGFSRGMAQRSLGLLAEATIPFEGTLAETNDPSIIATVFEDFGVTDRDLVLVAVHAARDSDPVYRWARKRISAASPYPFALLHDGDSLAETAAARIRKWFASIAPPMQREQRIALADDLVEGSQPNLEFLGLMSASSMLAAFGLMQNSAAVIIGAMLIAPLMTPIMGAGLGLAHGNRPLFQSSLLTIALGFIGALAASMMFGWLFWLFQEPTITDEMWARCKPSPLDFCVGLVGGLAASYARTRTHLSSALAGAAIAAALVPPIATAGLQLAFGQWENTDRGWPVVGPLLLVSINVITIMIGSSFILWARGMRSETKMDMRTRWALRMMALLSTIALLALTWISH